MAEESPTRREHNRAAVPADRDDTQSRVLHAAIARAKQEWESTVDVLPQVVCVLDSQRNVVRANRAIETWALGDVKEVQGRNLHRLLHRSCNGSECALAGRLEEAWNSLASIDAVNFELYDPLLERVLNVTLLPLAHGAGDATNAVGHHTVIVLSDITELYNVQNALRTMNEQLEARTQELDSSREGLSILSGQLMKSQEDERTRLSQELHDSVGQSLSAIKYSLERVVEMTSGREASMARNLLTTTIGRVQETVESIRSIAMNLRPSMLDDLGAVSAVRWFCREMGEIYPEIRFHTDFSVTDERVPDHLATPIFRTVQESLNNVVRHSAAQNVFVSIRGDQSNVMVEIRDDGVGFDPKEVGMSTQQGLGLNGLRERAAKTGGTFILQSKRRGGTVVRVTWPIRSESSANGKRRGFTLLELLVVMVIIGILAGFVGPRYFAQVGKSQVKAARAQIDAFDKGLDQYRVDMGRYPTSEEGLEGLQQAPNGESTDWGGPYLKKAVPLDPWGHAYVYVSPGAHGDIDIMSYGKDGQPGGSGENADITNW